MRKVETTIRFSPGTLDRLRVLAHLRSIETGKTVTWNQMVRQLVETHLLGGDQAANPEESPATSAQ